MAIRTAQHIRIEAKELEKPFAPLPAAVLFATEISMGARCLYAALVWLAWMEEFTHQPGYEGQQALADMMGVTRRTMHGYMNELREHSYIETERIGLGRPDIIVIKRLPASEWHPLPQADE